MFRKLQSRAKVDTVVKSKRSAEPSGGSGLATALAWS